jgi:hypothetical protein
MTFLRLQTKLIWMINRLGCMSCAEVGFRFKQVLVAQALKHGYFRFDEPVFKRAVRQQHALLQPSLGIFSEPYLQEADSILYGEVTLFAARRFNVGSPPIWNRDPLTGLVGPNTFSLEISVTNHALVGDIKYVWELNRHLHLVRLAQAYALSEKQTYLDGLAKQLDSWFETCPPLRGPNWTSSLEAGIRLISWSLIWEMLGGWDGVLFKGDAGERLRTRWLASVFAHCQFIRRHSSRHSSANNHLIGELAGLFVAGKTWPHWPQVEKWADEAKLELEREAIVQHSSDGVNREQAFAYQVFAAEFLMVAGIYGRRYGDSFGDAFWGSLKRACIFLRAVRDVGGHVPMVGDADDGMVLRLEPGEAGDRPALLLALSDAIFGKTTGAVRTDTVRWLLGDSGGGLSTPITQRPSKWQFPDGGYYVFGCNFGQPNEVKALLDCGPLGYLGIAAHGHADALAFTLSICGEECLIDPGTFSYWNELKWRAYFRGTSAHNTLSVDDLDQSVSGGRFMWTRKAKVTIEVVPQSPERFDFVGTHDGYMRLTDPVQHRRSVHYDATNGTLLVFDAVKCQTNHLMAQHWHFAPDIGVEVQGQVAIVSGTRFRMTCTFPGANLSIELFRGSEQPVLGWFSRTYESKVPSNTLRVSTTTKSTSITAQFKIELF